MDLFSFADRLGFTHGTTKDGFEIGTATGSRTGTGTPKYYFRSVRTVYVGVVVRDTHTAVSMEDSVVGAYSVQS